MSEIACAQPWLCIIRGHSVEKISATWATSLTSVDCGLRTKAKNDFTSRIKIEDR